MLNRRKSLKFVSVLLLASSSLSPTRADEFEKAFVVSSTDQIEARYILSPSMMRRLLDLRARHDNELHISFIANRIYLALPQHSDLFEPPSLRTPLTIGAVRRIIADLQSVLCIVEELDLNTRIWSKG